MHVYRIGTASCAWRALQDNANLFMVLEFVSGGEMFTHLRNSNKFRSVDAALPRRVCCCSVLTCSIDAVFCTTAHQPTHIGIHRLSTADRQPLLYCLFCNFLGGTKSCTFLNIPYVWYGFRKKLHGFNQNVPRVSENKDQVAVFM